MPKKIFLRTYSSAVMQNIVYATEQTVVDMGVGNLIY
jgi:hypothetical protein